MTVEYVRDKRSPVPKSEAVSRVMSANKAKNTKPELLLRKALWAAGHRGYRLHYRVGLDATKLPSLFRRGGRKAGVVATVRPDISFVGRKIAIFVHGCFWHRCPRCTTSLPKTNTASRQAK